MEIDDLAFDLANYTASEIESVLKDVKLGNSKEELISECKSILKEVDLNKLDCDITEAMIIAVLLRSLKSISKDCLRDGVEN